MSLLPSDVGLKNLKAGDEEIIAGFLKMFSMSCANSSLLYTASNGVTTEYGLRHRTFLAENQIVSDRISADVQQTILIKSFCDEFSSYADRFARSGGMIIPHRMEISPNKVSMLYYGVVR